MKGKKGPWAGMVCRAAVLACLLAVLMVPSSADTPAGGTGGGAAGVQTTAVQEAAGDAQRSPGADGAPAEAGEEGALFLGVDSVPLLVLTGLDSLMALGILGAAGVYAWKRLGQPG